MENQTIAYYNQNAASFIQGTVSVDFQNTQNKFLNALPGKRVLDFGCGSGRDTKYFLENGLAVTAMDGSDELCKYASAYTGIPVKNMMFQDLDEANQYDGIWACSSILHLPKKELKMVFHKMVKALDTNGIIYTSFKYGTFEGERNGRFLRISHFGNKCVIQMAEFPGFMIMGRIWLSLMRVSDLMSQKSRFSLYADYGEAE